MFRRVHDLSREGSGLLSFFYLLFNGVRYNILSSFYILPKSVSSSGCVPNFRCWWLCHSKHPWKIHGPNTKYYSPKIRSLFPQKLEIAFLGFQISKFFWGESSNLRWPCSPLSTPVVMHLPKYISDSGLLMLCVWKWIG